MCYDAAPFAGDVNVDVVVGDGGGSLFALVFVRACKPSSITYNFSSTVLISIPSLYTLVSFGLEVHLNFFFGSPGLSTLTSSSKIAVFDSPGSTSCAMFTHSISRSWNSLDASSGLIGLKSSSFEASAASSPSEPSAVPSSAAPFPSLRPMPLDVPPPPRSAMSMKSRVPPKPQSLSPPLVGCVS